MAEYFRLEFARQGMNKGKSTKYSKFVPSSALFYHVQINHRTGLYKTMVGTTLCGNPYDAHPSTKEEYEEHLNKAFEAMKTAGDDN